MALNANALISLEYAKKMIAFEDSQSETFTEYINVATSLVESYTGRVLIAADYTEYYDGMGTDRILLNQYPINTVTSVHIDPDRVYGDDTEVESTDYVLYSPTGKIVFPDLEIDENPQSVKVVYNAGYSLADMPSDIKLAMIETVKYIAGRVGAGNSRIGVKSVNTPDGLNTSYELTLPVFARSILDSYTKKGVA